MNFVDFIPASLIATSVTAALAWTQVMPAGEQTVVIRLPTERADPEFAALMAAGAAGAQLVGLAGPGFAILHGDASRIRVAAGLAPVWEGKAPCQGQ